MHNNLVENGMRPIAPERKNGPLMGSEAAGPRVAAAWVVESFKQSGGYVRWYVKSILPGLKTALAREVGTLTPHACKRRQRAAG